MGFGCVIPVLPLFAAQMGMGATGVGMMQQRIPGEIVFAHEIASLARAVRAQPRGPRSVVASTTMFHFLL